MTEYVPFEIEMLPHGPTGTWRGQCPLCEYVATAMLADAGVDRIVEHMNAEHHERHVGHA